jgi:peptidoglycan hydrolase CwlO-like protein
LKEVIDETVVLKKQLQQIKLEKEKSMEISLVEKIDLEEKNKLLEEEVSSKKKIIANLKKELDKAYSNQENLNKQERSIAQKSKELEYYSQELNEYNRLNDLRLKQQLSQLGK